MKRQHASAGHIARLCWGRTSEPGQPRGLGRARSSARGLELDADWSTRAPLPPCRRNQAGGTAGSGDIGSAHTHTQTCDIARIRDGSHDAHSNRILSCKRSLCPQGDSGRLCRISLIPRKREGGNSEVPHGLVALLLGGGLTTGKQPGPRLLSPREAMHAASLPKPPRQSASKSTIKNRTHALLAVSELLNNGRWRCSPHPSTAVVTHAHADASAPASK